MKLSSVCQGCLSHDRILRPLGQYKQIFDVIVNKKTCKLKKVNVTSDSFFCWECLQMFRNIVKFQNKVIKAQNVISEVIVDKILCISNIKPLSTLKRLVDFKCLKLEDLDDKPHINLPSNTPIIKNDDDKKLEVSIDNCVAIDSNDVTIRLIKIQDQNDDQYETDIDQNEINIDQNETLSDHNNDQFKKESETKLNNSDLNVNLLNNIKQEIDFDISYYEELDEKCFSDVSVKQETKKKKSKKKTKKTKKNESNSRWLRDMENLITEIPISHEELVKIRSQLKEANESKSQNLCDGCLVVPNTYYHRISKHCSDLPFVCDICQQTFTKESELTSHRDLHYKTYKCHICGDGTVYNIYEQITKHIMSEHCKQYRCRYCRKCFRSDALLKEHMQDEKHEQFKCNDCDSVFWSKAKIATHCRDHLSYFCKDCSTKFKNFRSYKSHMREKHTMPIDRSEASYCVECDIQFDNERLLKRHLSTSRKHQPKSDKLYPCSKCPNVYKRALTRNYHYDLVHVGVTRFYCTPCNRHFLNNYQLRRHRQSFHDRIQAPKNKLCSICGRGFSVNKALIHHLRTHTGERPHECLYCGAKYAQKYAMKLHMKNIHKHGTE